MLFNSLEFLAFLPVVWAAWYVAGRRARLAILLGASYLFYAGGDWRYVPLLALSTAVDWAAGLGLGRARQPWVRRALLGASLVADLGVLFAFKYAPFLLGASGLDGAAAGRVFHVEGHVPPGLSFYTFQTLSYTIDVWRGRTAPCRSPWEFALFVAFFPQLIAGPVLRADEFLPQLRANRDPTAPDVVRGFEEFFVGMFKKVVIADNIGLAIDPVFSRLGVHGGGTVALAVLLFAVQIYADFSGYSTMAVGLGRMFGFTLPRNFDYPWMRGTPLGYRRAWHITMSTWFRDYVFHPIGGTRHGHLRTSLNVVLVWTLFGVWHGAGWTFLLWGVYNGLLQAGWRLIEPAIARLPPLPAGRWLGIALNAAVFAPSMILFRVETPAQAWEAARRVLVWAPASREALEGGLVALAVLLVGYVAAFRFYDGALLPRLSWPARAALVGAMAVVLVALAPNERPFIYFRF